MSSRSRKCSNADSRESKCSHRQVHSNTLSRQVVAAIDFRTVGGAILDRKELGNSKHHKFFFDGAATPEVAVLSAFDSIQQ